jgi:hypothetical protein
MTEDERFDLSWDCFKRRVFVNARRNLPRTIARVRQILAVLENAQAELAETIDALASNVIDLGARR